MPLNFQEPEEVKKKEEEDPKKKTSKSPFGRKKKEAPEVKKPSTKTTVGGKASATHRRVFTKSSQYYATFGVKIIRAVDLPIKKSAQPYCQIYIGSKAFSTKTKKKTTCPEWNEEFSGEVDRDDNFYVKVWDMVKQERNVDVTRKIDPIGKKKIPMKEFARNGNVENESRTIQLVGGGSLEVEFSFCIKIPVPGEIHTKTFSYPSWMSDRYGVNQVEPDMDSINTGITTIARYTSRWLLNQRAIQASLNRDEEEDEEESEIPEGLQFKLIDISCCYHDKALELVICYTWDQKEETEDDDDLFVRPTILTSKLFSIAIKISKKKLYEHKSMSVSSYQEYFNKVREGTQEVLENAMDWVRDNRESFSEVYKLIPITTPHTHHALLWYYK